MAGSNESVVGGGEFESTGSEGTGPPEVVERFGNGGVEGESLGKEAGVGAGWRVAGLGSWLASGRPARSAKGSMFTRGFCSSGNGGVGVADPAGSGDRAGDWSCGAGGDGGKTGAGAEESGDGETGA